MSERLGLINKLKRRQSELSRLENDYLPRFGMGQFAPSKYEISHTIMQTVGVLGVFMMIGLFIGYALKKGRND